MFQCDHSYTQRHLAACVVPVGLVLQIHVPFAMVWIATITLF